jgi:FtsP/CotA-like multicopper oxidase with cupredoxin domain
MNRRKYLNFISLVLAIAALAWGGELVYAKNPTAPGQMKKITPADRQAAANQAQAARAAALAAGVPLAAAPLAGQVPDYFGVHPNYANSPLPVVTITGNLNNVGNPLQERAYATDYATAPGTLGPVFVVLPNAVLPAGNLESFEIWNQASTGGSPTASEGNLFHAYILRPKGVSNQYDVVFDSGVLTVLPTSTAGISELATFTVPTFPVQAGDVIGFYVEGIPVDVGGGTDILSYPAPAAPAPGVTITLGVDSGFPIYSQDRTYSFAANVNVGNTTISGGMRKFVDTLPNLTIATADTTTFPGSDYYEIELREYTQQMHADLPPTKLRGYVQVRNGADVKPISYLGPVIVAQSDIPVRIKFTNKLPTGAGGDLFIPVDTTYMGAGTGPDGTNYTENRSSTHLHGGATPWISDGTPHQWFAPAGESNPTDGSVPNLNAKGVSQRNVPDMWFDATTHAVIPGASLTQPNANATNDPGPGSMTFYYTNQQSARLMFYHDHAYGITRLNVYAGMAAGYLIKDPTEQSLISGGNIKSPDGTDYRDPVTKSPVPVAAGTIPDLGIPLVIQDKTFVPDNTTPFSNLVEDFGSQLEAQDPTWDTKNWGGFGQLWFPHVYMPNQNPEDITGANAMGRWDYGPWFWPPFTGLVYGPIANPYYDTTNAPWEPAYIPGTPDARGISPSGVPESFMDTPVLNGMAYPSLEVSAGPVRFRILNAANDRYWNLSLWVAADKNSPTTAGTTGAVLCDGTNGVAQSDCTEVKMVPFNSSQNAIAPFPDWWYTVTTNGFTFDDRAGGVPDPDTRARP